MTDDEKKIKELEQELNQLSSRLNYFREQISQLKKETRPAQSNETVAEPVPPASNKDREHPSHVPKESLSLENFIGLKLLHLTGIVVLVIGISIGVKYAVDKELISPVARIILAYSAGGVLYFFSVRLRKKFPLFSAILFSGTMASLYFTTYAAFAYYHLFVFGMAFGIMGAITVYTAYTAIRYDKQEIAILGMTGAYGIPFLISSNSGRADLFFTYIILINCGIVFLSYKKEWKAMVRLAMLVSWILFIAWAFTNYTNTLKTQSIFIMLVFYGMFAFASIGFSVRKGQRLELVELQLFLLNNILAFAAALLVFTASSLDDRAVEVTGMACLFFSLQALIARFFLKEEKLIFNYLVGFALLSLVFYAGMRWDGLKVTMIWLALAIGLFTAGVLSKTSWLRLLAIILMGVTLGKLILVDRANFTTEQKIISYISIGVVLLLLSFFYQKFRKEVKSESEIKDRVNSGTA
ncbi:MAG TPA: DUF2339 domain-containing protein [Chitinophagaceae bacterium]|jgi:uncharacterized membrane protein|nr:DUF2339 domain-containing protein [Chitinophagaceae bacterium]